MKKLFYVWTAILALSVSMVACGKKKSGGTIASDNLITVSCATCFSTSTLLARATSQNNSLMMTVDLHGDVNVVPPAGLAVEPEPLRWYGLYGAVPIVALGTLQVNSSDNRMCGAPAGIYDIRPISPGQFSQRVVNNLQMLGVMRGTGYQITFRLQGVLLAASGGGLAGRTTVNSLMGDMMSYGGIKFESVMNQPCASNGMPIW